MSPSANEVDSSPVYVPETVARAEALDAIDGFEERFYTSIVLALHDILQGSDERTESYRSNFSSVHILGFLLMLGEENPSLHPVVNFKGDTTEGKVLGGSGWTQIFPAITEEAGITVAWGYNEMVEEYEVKKSAEMSLNRHGQVVFTNNKELGFIKFPSTLELDISQLLMGEPKVTIEELRSMYNMEDLFTLSDLPLYQARDIAIGLRKAAEISYGERSKGLG